jgi:hypothetical protein
MPHVVMPLCIPGLLTSQHRWTLSPVIASLYMQIVRQACTMTAAAQHIWLINIMRGTQLRGCSLLLSQVEILQTQLRIGSDAGCMLQPAPK